MSTPPSAPESRPASGRRPESAGNPDDLAAELQRVRSERDNLAAKLTTKQRRQLRGGVFRRTFVGVLVALFAILLPITLTMGWAHRTVLNTDAYVKTVTPIATNPTVTASVSRQLTDQLYAALDPQAAIADALPPKASFLAGPIANGVKGFVQEKVNALLNSEQFQQFWVTANRNAHEQLVAVLRGKSNVVVTTNHQVVLNLVPVLNAALKSLQQPASQLVNKNIQLPQLSGTELPAVACEKISAALNRPLPPTCGQIVLFPQSKLDNARRAVTMFDRAVIALLIVTPLLAAAALAISRRRRRTLVQLLVTGGLALVIVRRVMMWLQSQLIATATPANKASRDVVVHDVLRNFFALTLWVLVGVLVVLLLTLLTGPYPWARALRDGVRRGFAWVATTSVALARAAAGKAHDESTVRWVGDHVDALRIGGVVVAVIILFTGVSFVGFLVLVALLAAYELWLQRLRDSARSAAGGTDGGSPPATGGPGPGREVPAPRS